MNTAENTENKLDWETHATVFTTYLKDLNDDEKDEGRPAALVLTKEDILRIKRYVRNSLNLPITLERVTQRLGFKDSPIAGLHPEDLLKTYQDTHQHASGWADIETGITHTGQSIDHFAKDFFLNGNQLIKDIQETSLSFRVKHTISTTNVHIKTDPDDETKNKIIALSALLENTAKTITEHEKNTKALSDTIKNFSDILQQKLIADVHHKSEIASKNGLEQKTQELTEDIDQLIMDIEDKNNEISEIRKQRWWGLLGGVVGYAIADGVTGKKAQKIRQQKDELINQKKQSLEKLDTLTALHSAVKRLNLDLVDMKYRMLEAHTATSNLSNAWGILAKSISQSAENLKDINDPDSLLEFSNKFQTVVTPWGFVKDFTPALLKIHAEALASFEQEFSTHSR